MPQKFNPLIYSGFDITGSAGGAVIGGIVAGSAGKSVLYTDALSRLQEYLLLNGELVIGSTGNIPVKATITQASANQVLVANGAGSITLSLPQDIALASHPSFDYLLLTKATNQLVLGTGNLITISATAPAASRLITLPDVGGDASFVLTAGDQSIADTKTFTDAVPIALTNVGFTASTPLKLDASKNIISGDIDLTTDVTGTLPIANGGTELSTAPIDGQLLIGNTATGKYVIATLTQTANRVTVTNGNGVITLSGPQDIHTAATPTFGGMTLTAFSGVVKAVAGVLSASAIVNADIDATAAIERSKIALGTADHVLINSGTGAMSSEARLALSRFAAGTINYALIGGGAGVDSAYGQLSLTAGITGVLPVANGGTNSSTALNSSRIMISTGGSIVESAALTDGQLFIGSTGAAPVIATLSQGALASVSITNTAGTITLDAIQDIRTSASPSFVSISLTSISNQMVLGTTRTVTITAPTPAANAIYTIPDVGATASFIMTELAQTINGVKTFTSTPLIGVASTTVGATTLYNATNAFTTTLQSAVPTASITLTLPNTVGNANDSIISDGSGNMSWSARGLVSTGVAGRLALYAASTNGVDDTYTQNTQLIDIAIAAHPALAAPREYTIPEVGASASFVMTEGSQTLNGVKTLTSTPLIGVASTSVGAVTLYNATNAFTTTLQSAIPTASITLTLPNTVGSAGNTIVSDGSGNMSWSANGSVSTGVAGRLALYPTSSSNVDDQYTQNANLIDVLIAAHPTLGASREYTIPDAGLSAYFVMTESAQTLNGVKTLTSAPVIGVASTTVGATTLQNATNAFTTTLQSGVPLSSLTLTLPITVGSAGDTIISDGSGNMSWTAKGTVNTGVAGRLALYPTSSSTVDDQYTQNTNLIDILIALHPTLAAGREYTIQEVGANASFVMTEGNQNTAGLGVINGSKELSAALTINPVANQLVLGGVGAANTITISAPTPATSSRTHTIPDVSASASFVMTEGAQTVAGLGAINGSKEFSAAVKINPTTNQLILGGLAAANTVTITAPTPAAASRTHTIPDVGASATFVMTAGAQTSTGLGVIGGDKTFIGTLQLGEASTEGAPVTGALKFAAAAVAFTTIIQASTTATASATYTLPTAAPTASDSFLTGSTAGVMSWVKAVYQGTFNNMPIVADTTAMIQQLEYNGVTPQTVNIFNSSTAPAGCIVTVIGTSNTNTVTFNNNDNDEGWLVNGSAELGRGHSITFIKSVNMGVNNIWVEVSRSIK